MAAEGGYDADGKLVEDTTGVALFKYKYDSRGNVVEEGFYNKDGKSITESVAFNRYKYDKDNRPIEESYHNARGELMADFEGVALIKYKYGKDGEIVSVEKYDTSKKLIKQ